MTIQVFDKTQAHILWLAPGFEDVSDEVEGELETEILPAVFLYWCPPGQQEQAIHHRCEPLQKFDPRPTEAIAQQAAAAVLNNPAIRLLFMAAINEQIRGITDE